jgi:hypothetical protein
MLQPEEIEVRLFPEIANIPNSDENYWVFEHPDRQWMKADIPWGHLRSHTHGDWVFRFIEEDPNEAPRGPAFQETWNQLTANAYDQPLTALNNQGPAIFVFAEVVSSTGDIVPQHIEISIDGVAKTAPTYKMVHPHPGGPTTATLSIPASLAFEGQTYTFSEWSDDCSAGTTRFVSTLNTVVLRARYRNSSTNFTDVSATAGIPSGTLGTALAWADFDSDDDLDLLVAYDNSIESSFLAYLNDGAGNFIPDSNMFPSPYPTSVRSLACADYNNDARVDVFATCDGKSYMFTNRGNGRFATAGSGPGDLTGEGVTASWGDYDGDGWVDLHVARYYAPNTLFRNLGPSSLTSPPDPDFPTSWLWQGFTNCSPSCRIGDSGPTHAVLWSDFNWNQGASNKVDLTVGTNLATSCNINPHYSVAMSNTTTQAVPSFSSVNVACGALGSSRVNGLTWCDLDLAPDVAPELVIADESGVKVLKEFADISASVGLPGTGATTGVATVDVDNDGDLDIVAGRPEGTVLFRNEVLQGGVLDFVGPLPLAPAAWFGGMAWADYDEDGDVDVAVRTSCGVRLYRNNLPVTSGQANYVSIKLVGTYSNRSAVGSKVFVWPKPSGLVRYREVDGGGGNIGSHSLDVECGLGSASAADILVLFPSGATASQLNVGANQAITITEPVPYGITITSTLEAKDAQHPEFSHYVTCPQGDGAPVKVTVQFPGSTPPKRNVAAWEFDCMTASGSPVMSYRRRLPTDFTLAGEQGAQSPTFSAVFRRARIGGCATGALQVLWNGVVIGSTSPIQPISPDFGVANSPGYVDNGDLAALAGALPSSWDPQTGQTTGQWNPCADFNRDNHVDGADVSSFAGHLSHAWNKPLTSHPQKAPDARSVVTVLPGEVPGTARVSVRLRDAGSTSAYGLVLQLRSPEVLLFRRQLIEHPQLTQWVVQVIEEHEPRIVLIGIGTVPSGDAAVADLTLDLQGQALTPDLVQVTYAGFVSGEPELTGEVAAATEGQQQARVGIEPNPFRDRANVRLVLPEGGHATIGVFDVRGRLVRKLLATDLAAGAHYVSWDGRDQYGARVGAGIYFVRLESREHKAVERAMVLR